MGHFLAESKAQAFLEMLVLLKPIELEVHNLKELVEGRELGINIFMLDNFDTQDIKKLSHQNAREKFIVWRITENTPRIFN